MSKVVKGIAKGLKTGLRSIKKGFKKLVSTKFGKVLAIVAAVYTGGAALGYWSSPFATATTAASATQTGTAVGEVAAQGVAAEQALATTALETGVAEGLGAEVLSAEALAGNTAQAVAHNPIGGALGEAAPANLTADIGNQGVINRAITTPKVAPETVATALPTSGSGVGAPAIPEPGMPTEEWAHADLPGTVGHEKAAATFSERVANAGKSILSFVDKNPMASAMALNTVSSAVQPDPINPYKEQAKQERISRARYNDDIHKMGSGIITSNMRPSNQPLRRLSTGQNYHQRG